VDNAAKRYMEADREVIVLVGNISDFRKDLKKFGLVRVIPLKEVDFGSADLVRTSAR